ncbi:hypothetical protein [Kibdelosporangium aridum]|uniref:hypothetical protein n=1 Tax=Kibdelosporangium aridum TaxID=2030 RepID=UPI000527BFD7
MPLQSWRCDTCRSPIDDATLGIVTWRHDDDGCYLDFRIVHKNMNGLQCDPGSENGFIDSLEIVNFLGPAGLGELLSWISTSRAGGARARGVVDLEAYGDLVRRLQLPFYEEARPFFGQSTRSWLAADGSDPDRPDTLKIIAAKGHLDR